MRQKTDSLGVDWHRDATVIKVTDGDPTTGTIIDLGTKGNMILVKIEGHKAEWVDTKDLVKYEDRS